MSHATIVMQVHNYCICVIVSLHTRHFAIIMEFHTAPNNPEGASLYAPQKPMDDKSYI